MEMTGDDAAIKRAVVLAGGIGTRLRPFTFSLPKPLVPIGETPIIDIVLSQLERAGVEHVTIAAGHMAGILMAYISARRTRTMCVDFHVESVQLGTAGPLAAIQDLDERFFVLNGDLLTSLRLTELAATHIRSMVPITIAACKKETSVPLGVIDTASGGWLTDYREKPRTEYLVSMGIYAMEPQTARLIGPGERIDLPDLVRRARRRGASVKVHEFQGYWRDIGTPEEYEQAQADFAGCDPVEKLALDAERGGA